MKKTKQAETQPPEAEATTMFEEASTIAGAQPGPEEVVTEAPAAPAPEPAPKAKKPANTPIIGAIEEFDAVPEDGQVAKKTVYPWDKLNPGQCFTIRGVAVQGVSRSAADWATKHPGYKVETRRGSDNDGEFIRVYRTA